MNYKFLAKNGLTLAFVLGLIGIIATMAPIYMGLAPFNVLKDTLGDDVTKLSMSKESDIFYYGIYVCFIFGIIALVLAFVFSMFSIFTNLKESKIALISFAVLAALFVVLNATASTDLTPRMSEVLNNPEYNVNGDLGIYKLISAGINGTLILMGLAFASMVLLEIWNFFKNS